MLPLAALNVLVLGWKPEWAAWSNLMFFFLTGIWLTASHLVDKLETDADLFRDLGIVLFLNFSLLLSSVCVRCLRAGAVDTVGGLSSGHQLVAAGRYGSIHGLAYPL